MRSKALIAISLGLAGAVFLTGRDALASYEEPRYEQAMKEGNIEIRNYPNLIAAEVTVTGDRQKAANNAFRILAGYIFGKNIAKEKISMTVPVTEQVPSEKIAMTVPVTEQTKGDSMTMRFFMPSKYSIDTLPEPVDKRIKFHQVPSTKYAVIRFAGFGNKESIDSETARLRHFLKEKGLGEAGAPITAFYNPPWTLPFLRRNEVWIPLSM